MSRIIHQPNDKIFKQSLLDIRVAKEFFKSHLSAELLDLIDLSSLSSSKQTFIDETYKAVEADVLYQVKLSNSNDSAYIYLLCENQSQVDQQMAFRLQIYMMRVMEMHLKRYPKSPLPIVYPLVIYTGEKFWDAPRDIFALFGDQAELARTLFYSPYQLIDVCRISDDDLKKNLWSGIVELVLKYRSVQDFERFLDILLPWLYELEKADGLGFAKIVLKYVVNGVQDHNEQLFIQKVQQYLSDELQGEAMTLAERFEEIGGEKKAEQIAINLLRKGVEEQVIAEATNLTLDKLTLLKRHVDTNELVS